MKRLSKVEESYSTDGLMLNTARALIQDFRNNLQEPLFCSDHLAHLCKGDIKGVRQINPELTDEMSTSLYKASYQIGSLMKRHRFENDLHSETELIKMSVDKFLSVQDHIETISNSQVSVFSDLILDRASMYIAKVLGKYDDEEHRSLCRFGSRASVGVPARLACEAARWELPLSGSLEQISWFDSEMSQVDCVQEYWINQLESDPNRSVYQETSSLKLTLVPKTFKSLRSIMPNTTIGSYMTYGLGAIMRKRLKKIGYDISNLQSLHKSYAKSASIHSMYATTDLSSASDTISVALVNRLFPADWLEILHKSRIGTVELPDGRLIESKTFCTMGVGYTFPLQTLVFLSLLKSLSLTLYGKLRSTISVYGDDMIYPSYLHPHVVELFREIGFVINNEKSFTDGYFRESCGGDYYRGVDVRPFQPRNGATNVGPKAYEAVLYKYVNGLLARWSEYEIKETLNYLVSEIGRVAGTAKVVPVDFPDDAGIKCPTLSYWQFLAGRTDVAKPKHLGHGVFRFSYLRFIVADREEKRHEPYVWLSLRGDDQSHLTCDWRPLVVNPSTSTQSSIDRSLGVKDNVSPLVWVETDQTVRSSLTGRRCRRQSARVTVSHTGSYKRRSGTSGFEDRRQLVIFN